MSDSKKTTRRRKYRLKRARRGPEMFRSAVIETLGGGDSRKETLALEDMKQNHELEMGGLKDRILRAHADMENLRKRTAREKEDIKKFANENLIANILPALDNFDHAVKAAERNPDFNSFLKGIQITRQDLLKILSDAGLQRIPSDGETFDPRIHEAMSTGWSENVPEGSILELLREGYTLQGRVLRPAWVKVNKKQEKAAEPAACAAFMPNPQIKPEPLNQAQPVEDSDASSPPGGK